jgi:hypothetical protein
LTLTQEEMRNIFIVFSTYELDCNNLSFRGRFQPGIDCVNVLPERKPITKFVEQTVLMAIFDCLNS